MDEPCCVRCQHPEDNHDPSLGYCEVEDCLCLGFISEYETLEADIASGEIPELDFDHEDEER